MPQQEGGGEQQQGEHHRCLPGLEHKQAPGDAEAVPLPPHPPASTRSCLTVRSVEGHTEGISPQAGAREQRQHHKRASVTTECATTSAAQLTAEAVAAQLPALQPAPCGIARDTAPHNPPLWLQAVLAQRPAGWQWGSQALRPCALRSVGLAGRRAPLRCP